MEISEPRQVVCGPLYWHSYQPNREQVCFQICLVFSWFMIFVTGGSRLNVLCQEVAARSFPGKYILCHDCWMDSQFWISFDRIIQLLQLSPGLYVETTKQG